MITRKKLMLAGMLVMASLSFAQAKYVFYFIGDGMGAAQRQIAEEYKKGVLKQEEKLLLNSLPFAAITTTYAKDTLITDSAAAGTALATGSKTNNGYIAKDSEGKDVKTALEVAQEKGKATGLVTTTRITHATPAVFASHNINRDNENEIAEDYVKSKVDYFAGGGYRHFVKKEGELKSKQKDDRDLVKEFQEKGYKTFVGEKDNKAFKSWKPKKGEKAFVALKASHMPYEIDRQENTPSLKVMTEKGIELLKNDKDGFFLMVEGGRIDHASHANDVMGTIYDTLAFDEALKSAYDFYQKHPKDTLIVVAADHETGGMGLGFGNNYFLQLEALKNVKVSIEDVLQETYNGNRPQFFEYIAKNMGLQDITEKEKAMIEKAMDLQDQNKEAKQSYGGYSPVAISVAHILSERAGLQWTSYAHTAVQVPLAAIGKGAEAFVGFKDNTEVGKLVKKSI